MRLVFTIGVAVIPDVIRATVNRDFVQQDSPASKRQRTVDFSEDPVDGLMLAWLCGNPVEQLCRILPSGFDTGKTANRLFGNRQISMGARN
jgi:hypothetical protein